MEYLTVIFAYLLGSMPFGFIMGKLLRKTDIRDHGSGNIGSTNVLRLMGPITAVTVLLLDAGKGVGSVFLARAVSDDIYVMLACGIFVVLGHCFPVFLRFRGGKGAATGMGVMLSIPGFILPFMLILLAAALIITLTRYVSLASVAGSALVPLAFLVFGFSWPYILFGVLLGGLLIWQHRANLSRLVNGTESKIGQK